MTEKNYHLVLALCRCARKDASNATLHQMKRLSNWYHENDEPEMAATLADIVNQKPANENEPRIERSTPKTATECNKDLAEMSARIHLLSREYKYFYYAKKRSIWQKLLGWLRDYRI